MWTVSPTLRQGGQREYRYYDLNLDSPDARFSLLNWNERRRENAGMKCNVDALALLTTSGNWIPERFGRC